MANEHPKPGYKFYWGTWATLLVFTLLMLGTSLVTLPKAVLIGLLLVAMLVKASLIGAHFMHLRFEKLSLGVMVAAGILATAAILFGVIAFDGLRILRLSLN